MNWCISFVLVLALVGLPHLAIAGDCETTAACPETDVNCDNETDGFDVAVVRNTANWLLSAGAAVEPRADVNGDGIVDGFDIAAIRNTACWLQGGFTETELAGDPLSGYPYFHYVKSFHENAPVNVAIDPTRFPAITGQTCDIYVVSAKTDAEWDADKTLDDVTAGGALTETFSGATIQDNTVVVAAASELDADAGIGLGVGYDVVLDCNQNGQLGAGDYIDGIGDEAGLYVVADTTVAGPLAVTEIIYTGGTWLGQDTYYPTDIASMGQLPLVVVSHGNGHNYQWYDHIGRHLASYGYLVMSHQNDTGPGVETASETTLNNTDYIIANQATISGGVLNGHIDSSRITWIGHSRGAEGVVRAHSRLRAGTGGVTEFDINDMVLVSSIAPVTFISPPTACSPWDENYHMFIAGADADVTGSAGSGNSKPLAIYERGFGNRQLDYVHGAGHGDFHDGGGSSVADGPALIGRPTTHIVVRGYYLPLVELYVRNNSAAQDFFTRLYDDFHPIGIPAHVIVSNEYKDAAAAGNVIIDDYQAQTSTAVSSSGGAVTFDVTNVVEVLMQDTDGSFSWTGTQPSNGMTRFRYTGDNHNCVVFDWAPGSHRFYDLAVVPAQRDFSDNVHLSFRACQGTQHPYTNTLDGPLSFTASLTDGAGTSSSIDFGVIGGVTRTYERTGGWANEFCTVRLRLTDFQNNGSGIDLSDIASINFDFGADYGSALGRIGLDDIELTQN